MAIRVSVRKSRGIDYVSLTETCYETVMKDGKPTKVRKFRTIKSLGSLAKLEAKNPGALERLKKQYESPITAKRLRVARAVDQMIAAPAPAVPAVSADAEPITLNYGIWALKPVWDDWLGLRHLISRLQESDSKLGFDVSRVLSYLAFVKIADPASRICAFEAQSLYLCGPLDGISSENVCESLSFIAEHKDRVMEYIHKRLTEDHGRKTEPVFCSFIGCDPKNPYPGCVKPAGTITEGIRKRQKDEGMTAQECAKFRPGDDFLTGSAAEPQGGAPESDCLRLPGTSAEKRRALPGVSVALVTDAMGIPVDFQVFSGAERGAAGLPEFPAAMKAKYGIRNMVLLSDGSGTASGLLNKDLTGFIAAQSLSGAGRLRACQAAQIGEYFRVMKNGFPVRTENLPAGGHIRGHVTVCVLALIMLRLLQIRLSENSVSMSFADIRKAIAEAEITALSADGQDGIFIKPQKAEKIRIPARAPKKSAADKRDRAERGHGVPDAIDQILSVTGLEPLNAITGPDGLAKRLKLPDGYRNLVGNAIWRFQADGMAGTDPKRSD